MQERYRMYQRDGGMFYAKDRKTGHCLSLATTDFAEAKRLLAAKNQATEQPFLNVAMAMGAGQFIGPMLGMPK